MSDTQRFHRVVRPSARARLARPGAGGPFPVLLLSSLLVWPLALGCGSNDSATSTGTAGATQSSSSGGGGAGGSGGSGGGGTGGTSSSGGAATYEDAVLAASWEVLPNAPTVAKGKQDDLFFTTPDHGFAVSGPATSVYETKDGGATWSAVFKHTGTYFRSVLFTDDMHGFASNLGPIAGTGITDTTLMYETKDGGATWNPVSAVNGPMPTGICNQSALDAQHLFASGRVTGPSFLMTSSDGGATWTSIDMNADFQMLIDVHFFSQTEGILVGGTASNPMKCTILRTTDGAKTFTPVFTSATDDSLCWKIAFPSATVGYVSVQDTNGGKGTFAKTTDGGKTWTEMPLFDKPYAGIGIGFITEDIGWVASDSSAAPVLRTTDGGKTWAPDPVLKSPVNRFRFVNKQTAYAIGGKVYKLTVDWKGN